MILHDQIFFNSKGFYMRKEAKGIFRGAAVAWYDSDKLCLIFMGFMALVNFFGWSGLSTVFSRPEWNGYWHLPVILIAASAFVFLSIIRRVIVRNLMKKPHDAEFSL